MRTIHFIRLGLACGLAIGFNSNAALLVHEPFEYPVGNLINLNGGTGWPASWTNTGNGTVASPGLAYDDIWSQLISSGNACGMNTTANARDLPGTYGSAGQTIYVSFLGRVDSAFAAGLALSDGNAFRCRIGRVTQPTWQVADLTGVVIDSGLSSLQTSLLVVRLDFAASTVTMRLYVNPPLAAEPATPTGSVTRPTFAFNRIQVLGSGANVRLIDEIRMGTTWADVTPHAPAPVQCYVSNPSLPEGNSGTTDFVFNVGLNQAANQPVTVDFFTANGTALAGSDYVATNGSLTFSPGETNKAVIVRVNGDTTVEYDETFRLVLTNSVNAGISSLAGAGTGTIRDDDFVTPALFAEEQFRYLAGSAISGLNGGTGWSNTWIGTFGGATVISPGLTHTDGSSSLAVSSNAASLNGSFVAQTRPVRDLDRVKDGTLYVSFIGRVDSGSVALTLNRNGVATFSIGRNNASANWNVSHPVGDWSVVSAVPTTTQSFIVLRVDYSGANMTVRLYVNPALSAEPAVPVGQTNLPAARFDTIALSTLPSGVAAFDEIRVASTWAAAVPLGAAPPPRINVADAAAFESNTGTNLLFNVSLSYAYPGNVTANFSTSNGTAIAGSDYVATNGLLTFAPGETNKVIVVPVIGDAVAETNETLGVHLSNAVNGVIQDGVATGTILDEDTPPRLAIGPGRVFEGDSGVTQAVFRVRLDRYYNGTVSVDYATTNGTATAGEDYVGTNGTVTFGPGEMAREISVIVFGDTERELNETFFVRLSNVVNAVLFRSAGPGLIGGDDSTVPEITVLTLLSNGDPVPGEPGRVVKEFFGAPVINVFNEIAFVASTTDANGANGQTNLYLWLGPTNELVKVAGSGMPTPPDPDGNTNILTGKFDLPNLSDQGFMSFFAGSETLSQAPGFSAAQNGKPFRAAGDPEENSDLFVWRNGDGSDDEDVIGWLRVEQTPEGGSTLVPSPSAQPLWAQEALHSQASSAACEQEFEFHSVVDPVFHSSSRERGACTEEPGSGGEVVSILSRDVVVRPDGTWVRVRQDNSGHAEVNLMQPGGTRATVLRTGNLVGSRIIMGFEANPGAALTESFVVIQTFTQPGFRSDLFAVPHENGLPGEPILLPQPETMIGYSDKISAVEVNGTAFVASTEPGFTDTPNKVSLISFDTTPPFTPNNVDIARVGNLIATPSGSTAIAQIDPTSLKLLPNGRFQFWVKLIGGSSALVVYNPRSSQPPKAVVVFGPNEDVTRVPEAAAGNGAQQGANADGTVITVKDRTTGDSKLTRVAVPTRTKPLIQFGQAIYGPVAEGQTVQLTVTRIGDLSGISGAAVWLYNGSAKRGPDFRAVPDGDPVFVTFAPGETLKTVAVRIEDDTETEFPESFHAYLKDDVNADFGNPRNAEVKIEVSDGTPLSEWELRLGYPTNGLPVTNRLYFQFSTTNGVGYMEVTPRLSEPFKTLPGAGNPTTIADDTMDDAVHYLSDFGADAFFRLANIVATGTIRGTARNPDGTPWSGIVSIGDGEQAIGTDGAGNFRIENVPAGEVPLSFWGIYSVSNAVSGQVEHVRIRITVFVTLVAGGEAIVEVELELPRKEEKPPCNCVPWCGIVGGTFNGVQKVVAGGGKRGECADNPTVIVTGPFGINHPIRGKPRSFSPAANGTWTVTATICGITKECRITLP